MQEEEAPGPRLVVGLTGLSQSGKDTAGSFLAERGYARYAFADRLKETAYAFDPIIPVSHPHLHGLSTAHREHALHSPGSSSGPHLYRYSRLVDLIGVDGAKEIPEGGRTLQRMGTEAGWMVHGPRVWVDLCEERFERELEDRPSVPVVITDVRFPHEEEWLRERGGVLLRIVRPELVRESTRDQSHPSELGQALLSPDAEVLNDGTLDELRERLDDALEPLLQGRA